jgi:hypothetical protein
MAQTLEMWILTMLALLCLLCTYNLAHLPADFKQIFLGDVRLFLQEDEVKKLDLLPADLFETAVKLIYSNRLKVGTICDPKLTYSVYNFENIIAKEYIDSSSEAKLAEIIYIIKEAIEYYSTHGYKPILQEDFYKNTVLANFQNSVNISDLTTSKDSKAFKTVLEINNLLDQIHFLSRPLLKLFGEDVLKTTRCRHSLATCFKESPKSELDSCLKSVFEWENLSLDKFQEIKDIIEVIYPFWTQCSEKYRDFSSNHIGKITVKDKVDPILKAFATEKTMKLVKSEPELFDEEDDGSAEENKSASKLKVTKSSQIQGENPPNGLSPFAKFMIGLSVVALSSSSIIIIIILVKRRK